LSKYLRKMRCDKYAEGCRHSIPRRKFLFRSSPAWSVLGSQRSCAIALIGVDPSPHPVLCPALRPSPVHPAEPAGDVKAVRRTDAQLGRKVSMRRVVDGETLNNADPARLEGLDGALRLDMVYDAEVWAVDVTIRPAGGPCE
jgi:hypothetical protein